MYTRCFSLSYFELFLGEPNLLCSIIKVKENDKKTVMTQLFEGHRGPFSKFIV